MKAFKDLGIKSESKGFVGDKIKISKILNREIVVSEYKVVESNYKGKCLHLQIAIGENRHVVFTGSNNLIEQISKVEKADFPFTTTIVMEDERYEFT